MPHLFRDLLNKQATEALKMVKSDFQHCYRMWTSCVDFLDEKKTKINIKN